MVERYSNLKHHDIDCRNQGNLSNLIYAWSAFILLYYSYNSDDSLYITPNFLSSDTIFSNLLNSPQIAENRYHFPLATFPEL